MSDEIAGKIHWCGKQKKGIKLTEPNENLCTAYIRKAETSLKSMHLNHQAKIYDWAVDAAYYARYQAFYGLLQKCGISCEIHDCSIMLLRFLFADIFDEAFFRELENAKDQRINLVYYTNRIVPQEEIEKNIASASGFVLKMEEFTSKMNSENIQVLQQQLKKGLEERSKK